MGQPGTIGALLMGRRRSTPPPAITWGAVQQNDPDLAIQWYSVAYSPTLDLFVRCGSQGWYVTPAPGFIANLVGRIDWSTDGENWTPTATAAIGPGRGWQNVMWLPVNQVFVAIRDFTDTPSSQGLAAVSTDGKNWVTHVIPGSGPSGVPFPNTGSNGGQGCAVVVPDGVGGEVIVAALSRIARNQRSTDGGVTWLTPSMRPPAPTSDSFQNGCVANADGSLVLAFDVNQAPLQPERTVDRGVSWSRGSVIPHDKAFVALGAGYSPPLGMFVVTGYDFNDPDDGVYNSVLFTSLDGDSWTRRGLPSRDFWYAIQWVTPPSGAPFFLSMTADTADFTGLPDSESYEFIYSYDGQRWFGGNAPSGWGWANFCVGQGKVVAVGNTYDNSPDFNITGITVVGTMA